MSRLYDIRTGESYMTEVNALRHYLVKARKLLKSNDANKKRQFVDEVARGCNLNISCCDSCDCEDFGMCGLRHTSIPSDVLINNYCYISYVK